MRLDRRTLRWTAATALAAAAVLTTGSSNALADSQSSQHPSAQGPSASTAQNSGSKADSHNYRGVQGFNLCLVSRCTIGSGAGNGDGSGAGAGAQTGGPVGEGIRQAQGANLCLLSTCTVQP